MDAEQVLLDTLRDLTPTEVKKFFRKLKERGVEPSQCNPCSELEPPMIITDLLTSNYKAPFPVTVEILREIGCHDKADRLAVSGKFNEDIPWAILEPQAELGSTISHQSEAGHFECSVSGLRWVCKEKVSFEYHFVSWDKHIERLENMEYVPGGPLLDVKVFTGKIDDVYLPHWICIVDNPEILATFKVLHVDTCGDVVESVSEVTPSHVKISQPVFSPRGVLLRAGIQVRIKCKVLIYKTNKDFLTLHVYLIPRDPALQKKIEEKEASKESKSIEKPNPEKPLQMRQNFILRTDKKNAEISPGRLKLIYESDPNYFEVHVKNPGDKIELTLENKCGDVWTRAIRTGDYQNTDNTLVMNEADLNKFRRHFVERISSEVIKQLLDDLLIDAVLNHGETEAILEGNDTKRDMARCLFDTVKNKGEEAIRVLMTRFERRDPTLYKTVRTLST